MSDEEKYHTRDLSYSAWHRPKSIARFIGLERAQPLAMIDCDSQCYIEYNRDDYHPIILIESAIDIGQDYKCAAVITNLAKMADIPALVVLYTRSDKRIPEMPLYRDLSHFKIKYLYPKMSTEWEHYTPAEYARKLVKLREKAAAYWQSRHMN